MRKILFRAKRLDNGEWIHGYYATKGVDDKTIKHFICEPTFDPNGSCYCGMFYLMDYEVNPDTVGQFTGLHDKNGKEIYEGDIIESINDIGQIARHKILYEQAWGGWVTIVIGTKFNGYYFRCNQTWITNHDKKVIGNIHDNPELLKRT